MPHAEIAQLVEHTHGKGEVPSSILGLGSKKLTLLRFFYIKKANVI